MTRAMRNRKAQGGGGEEISESLMTIVLILIAAFVIFYFFFQSLLMGEHDTKAIIELNEEQVLTYDMLSVMVRMHDEYDTPYSQLVERTVTDPDFSYHGETIKEHTLAEMEAWLNKNIVDKGTVAIKQDYSLSIYYNGTVLHTIGRTRPEDAITYVSRIYLPTEDGLPAEVILKRWSIRA